MLLGALLLAGVGVVLVWVAIAMPSPHVTAVRVIAKTSTALRADQCSNGGTLTVRFTWARQEALESLDSPL
jgi:hypothetical protein